MMGSAGSRTKTAPPNADLEPSDPLGPRGGTRPIATPGPPSMAGAAASAPRSGASDRKEATGDDCEDDGSAPGAASGSPLAPASGTENEEDEMLSPLESALHHLSALEQDAAEGADPTLDGPTRRHHLRATRRALEALVNATGGSTTMFTPTILSGLVLNSPKRERGQPRVWQSRPPRHPDAMAAPAGAAPPDEAASGVPPRGLSNPASGGGEPAADTDGSGCPQPKGRPQDALATASPGLDGSLPASEGGRRSRLTLGQRLGRTPPDRASSGRASAGTGLLQRSHSLSSMGLAGDSPAAGAETGRDTASKTHGRSIGGSLLSFSTDVSARERSPSYRRLFADRSTRDWLTSQYAAAARVSAVPTATARRVGGPSEGGRPRSADACGEEETGAAGASTRRILPQECDTLAEEEAARLEELVKDLCGDATLCVVTHTALARLGVEAEFSLPCDKVEAFALHVARNYSASVIGSPGSNPYHTALHAADVTQSVLSLVEQHSVLRDRCKPMEILALVLGAAVHDYRHKGVTNAFLAATEHEENMSLAEAFHALKRPELNAVASLDPEQKTAFRKAMISMVLATDLAKHFDYVGRFKVKTGSVSWEDENDRQLVLAMSIKAADIGHPAKPWSLHKRWSSLITAEFFRQGDRERELGLPVSPLCDRESVQLPKSQLGFIAFLVRPMFELYCDLLDDEALLHNVDSNEAEWKRKEEELDGDAATEASDGSGELGVVEGRNGEEALDGARVEHGQGEEKQTEEPYEHGRECLQEGEGEKKGEQSTDHDRELKQKDWQAEESAKVQEGGDRLSNGGPEEGGAQ